MVLTERQKKILITIVEAYTENKIPEPIGSSTLTQNEDLNVSSATLRNEMAALEDMGLLEKTHTSSGRVPTELGYRVYVDELMNVDSVAIEMEEQVEAYMEEHSKLTKKEAAIELIKTVIDQSDINYGAIILEKTAFNSRIKKIDFTYIHHHRGIFLLITDHGLVLYKEVALPEGINVTSIEKTVAYLNEKLQGVLLNDFKSATVFEIKNDGYFDYVTNADLSIEFVIRNIRLLVDDKKQVIGQFNVLHHPDFADIGFAQEYLETLKNNTIYKMAEFDNGPLPVLSSLDSNISIKIGHENGLPVFNNFSFITAYYQSKNGTGSITIYGPIRMKYRLIVSLLNGIIRCIN